MLNLFSKPLPLDVATGFENIPLTVSPTRTRKSLLLTTVLILQSCAIFSGSPRDLIMSSDIKALASKLKEIPGCSLFFKLCSHKKLLDAQHLVSENECIGR